MSSYTFIKNTWVYVVAYVGTLNKNKIKSWYFIILVTYVRATSIGGARIATFKSQLRRELEREESTFRSQVVDVPHTLLSLLFDNDNMKDKVSNKML